MSEGRPEQRGRADETELRAMVDRYASELKAAGAIESAAVERAFRTVERHRLLETFHHRGAEGTRTLEHDPGHPRRDHLALIYADTVLATRHIDGRPASSTSQASLVARMLELLDLGEGMKILEVGAGTGYNAALLAEIVGDQRLVVTVDVLADVVDQTRRLLAGAGYPRIQVLLRDGFEGAAEHAPFDRIVATVGCSDLSPRWAGQLADHGAMLVPLEHASGHPLVLLSQDGEELRGRLVLRTGFIPVRGPLHIEDLWAPGVCLPDQAEVAREPDPGPRFTARQPDQPMGPDDEDDFLFYLGLHDRRACHAPEGPALSAGPDGWAALAPDGMRWWKDVSLARELDRRYREWDARGRPGMGDYQISFVPINSGGDPPPGGWQIERRFYRERLTLG
ncbi:MAG TPA: methyltransferase domain-containing protein [Streptosporangiaceae bacterium]|nr:methyltransferase domain-containing protein [Streptosporangiaceae bacterium]